jgi:hypothetical protein
MLIYLLAIAFLIFATVYELKDSSNSYDMGKPGKKDTIRRLVRKLSHLSAYDIDTIKWRRLFIASCVATFALFALVRQRIPDQTELVLYVLVIYIVFAIQWKTYSSMVSSKVVGYTKVNLLRMQTLIGKITPEPYVLLDNPASKHFPFDGDMMRHVA